MLSTGFISGDGKAAIDEVGSPRFLLLTAACWNGIAMGAIDIARHHVTTKEHADVGMRIADYPTIQVSVNKRIGHFGVRETELTS